jgi:alpha-tubulin suppressor-like RCC1 family protein
VLRRILLVAKKKKATGGLRHSAALTNSGAVWTWGCGKSGRLMWVCVLLFCVLLFSVRQFDGRVSGELGRMEPGSSPSIAELPRHCIDISCGPSSCVAVDITGALWVWGALMDEGFVRHARVPREIRGQSHCLVRAAAGEAHVAVLESPESVALR